MKDLQSLMIFAKVMDTGSFSRAAIELGMGKASISRRIKALEQELGLRLLQRSTRKLSPTEEGKALYLRCKRIREEVEAAESEVSQAQQAPRGTLRVGASPMLAQTRLVSLIPAFLRRYPEISIELRVSSRPSELIAGGFDLALQLGELEDSSLVAQRLGFHQTVLCAAPAYLEQHGVPTLPLEVEQHNVLMWTPPDRPPFTRIPFSRNGEQNWIRVGGNFSCNDAMALREAALRGGGLVLLPDFAIAEELRDGRLVALLSDFVSHRFPVSVIYPGRAPLSPKLRAFVEYLREAFAGPGRE